MRKTTVFILLLLTAQGIAQTAPTQRHRASVWLKTSMGTCITENYDIGTTPFTDLGVGIAPGFGAVAEWKKFHVETDIRVPVSYRTTMGAIDVPIDERVEFLYHLYSHPERPLRVWVGGDLQAVADIKYSSQLMNAAVSASSFVNLNATGWVQYDFATLRRTGHKLLTAQAKLSLPLVGIAERPGFAYIDNYNSDINLANTLFQDQETFFNPFAGVSADLGLILNLSNGNRIALSYRWDYLTTARRGTYRYDNAIHTLSTTYLFNLY